MPRSSLVSQLLRARRLAGRAVRWTFPPPEVAAMRRIRARLRRVPRHAPGEIRLLDYRLRYLDLLSVAPQWQSLFVEGSYDFAAGSPTPRILDCGANIGLASLWFKRRYPGARITAYEADPAIHRVLVENLARNGAADVEAVQAAVWLHAGTLTFRCEGTDSGTIAELAGPLEGESRTVPAVSLREVLEREAEVDLLKLDVEGAESGLLADCAAVLARVRAALVEIHEFDPARRRTAETLEVLTRAGFTYGLDELTPLPWRGPVAPPGSSFPGRALSWVVLARAFRPAG